MSEKGKQFIFRELCLFLKTDQCRISVIDNFYLYLDNCLFALYRNICGAFAFCFYLAVCINCSNALFGRAITCLCDKLTLSDNDKSDADPNVRLCRKITPFSSSQKQSLYSGLLPFLRKHWFNLPIKRKMWYNRNKGKTIPEREKKHESDNIQRYGIR